MALWFKSAPVVSEIQDREIIKKSYTYWRIRIFYGMYAGYVFYYFSRKSLTFAMPSMIHDLGLTKADVGLLATILSLTYGVSKFLSGVLSDKSNPRYFMGIGLIITGLINILFGISSSIIIFSILWALNGWFQGWGWPPCARLLTHWYSQKERGTWWGFWNTSHNTGGALIPLLAAYCAQTWGWCYAMYIPGGLCILMGLFVINRLRDTPQSLGLPPIEKYKNDYPSSKVIENELTFREILLDYILKNKLIWILAAAYFLVYVVRTAFTDWTIVYLVEAKGYSLLKASTSVVSFEIGGIIGSLTAGIASDRLFNGKRGPVNVLFCFAASFGLIAFFFSPAGLSILELIFAFFIGFLIFGPQMLIGVAAAELSSKKTAGAATGFIGLFAYIGAACAGYPLGRIAEVWGWSAFFITLILCGSLSSLLLLPLWSIKSNPKLKN